MQPLPFPYVAVRRAVGPYSTPGGAYFSSEHQGLHLAAEKKGELQSHHVWFQLIQRFFDAVETGFTYVPIPLFVFLTVRELAGKTTIVSFVADYFSKVGHSAPWSLATLFGLWGIGERKLRQRKVKNMSDHIQQLEQEKDPNRTSSGLTQTGQTPSRRRKRARDAR